MPNVRTPATIDSAIVRLPLDQLEIDAENVRTHYDEEMVDGFRDLLRSGGEYINPPHVYSIGGDRYRVKHGNTRVLAAQGIVGELPVRIVDPPASPEERVMTQLCENLAQGGLSPLDTARALLRLRKSGLSIRGIQEHLAEHGLKRSVAWIHGLLKMLDLPDSVQTQIERGEVKPWEAVAPTDSKVVRVPVEAMQAEARQELQDLAVQLLNKPSTPTQPVRRGPQERSGPAPRRWEILPMEGDSEELLEKASVEARQDVAMALNALRLVIENGVPAKDSAGGILLRSRLRRLR